MANTVERTIDPAFEAIGETGGKEGTNWVRAALFFLLGFVLLSEPMMLVLLLYKNGTFSG